MSNLVIYRFQPDAMEEDVLRKLFVGRRDLFDEMRDEIEKALENRTPRYYLIVGSRGIGKSHFITLLYYETQKLKGASSVKLSEEEFSIYRVSDLFARIFEEIEKKKIDNRFEMDEDEIVDTILEDLKSRNKMIIVFIENLNQILGEQMEEREVKRLRSIFQEEDIFIVIATSPLIFTAVSQGTEPFFHFFDVKHLRELSKEEVVEMLKIIDELEGKSGNLEVYYGKIDSIIKLTGGSPRIVILLYDLMSKGDIHDVENAFFKILDEYTPYYQDVFRNLTGQKRRIFDVLISLGKPSTPKEIAATARLGNNTVITQLRRLEKDGYVASHRMGRSVKYEVRERLFRLWREQRQPLGRKRISILIEFLRLWYTPEEREKEFLSIISHLEGDNTRLIRRAEYLFCTLPEESKIKFVPEITRGFYELGMPRLLEEFAEIGDEKLEKVFESEKFKFLFENRKYDDLLEETEKIIRKDEKNEIAWFYKGFVLGNLQRYEEALQAFDRALEIDPEDADAWFYKGVALGNLQRYEEALQAFDRALEINPEHVGALFNKGVALGNLQRYEEALQAYNRALA